MNGLEQEARIHFRNAILLAKDVAVKLGNKEYDHLGLAEPMWEMLHHMRLERCYAGSVGQNSRSSEASEPSFHLDLVHFIESKLKAITNGLSVATAHNLGDDCAMIGAHVSEAHRVHKEIEVKIQSVRFSMNLNLSS